MAYLRGYQICCDPILLEAARETAEALIRGQLHSGGWDHRIEFAAEDRKKYGLNLIDTVARNISAAAMIPVPASIVATGAVM